MLFIYMEQRRLAGVGCGEANEFSFGLLRLTIVERVKQVFPVASKIVNWREKTGIDR